MPSTPTTSSSPHSGLIARDSQAHARVTLAVLTDNGRSYLYDDVTGAILPWSALREAILSAHDSGRLFPAVAELKRGYPAAEVESARAFVLHWIERYGAFFRSRSRDVAIPDAETCSELGRELCTQLILSVTESCNLRCRYCGYSGNYDNERSHSERSMSPETGRKAIDWFVRFIEPQRATNPRKQFGLTFYGGEPLLNLETVWAVLEYVDQRHPQLFLPTLTTNGLLLTRETAALLARHRVLTNISLDGPQEEHDRERVDRTGCGTFERVFCNVTSANDTVPGFRQCAGLLSVYSTRTDLAATSRFFDEHKGDLPPVLFAMPVKPGHRQFSDTSPAQMEDFAVKFRVRVEAYKERSARQQPVNSFDNALAGAAIVRVLLRDRIRDTKRPLLPYTGTCVPGQKVAVRVDGTLDMCERVNDTCPIGHLDTGIDGDAVRRLLSNYRDVVTPDCWRCAASKLCTLCFAQVMGDGAVKSPASNCEGMLRHWQQAIGDFLSIKEANPRASLLYASGSARVTNDARQCSD